MCLPAAASHLVTGNGFGFAVVAPESGSATNFYPHPHSFVRADPANPLERRDRDRQLSSSRSAGASAGQASADYVADSHVIRLRARDGTGISSCRSGSIARHCDQRNCGVHWRVEWNPPLRSQQILSAGGAGCCGSTGSTSRCYCFPSAGCDKPPRTNPSPQVPPGRLVALENERDAEPAIRDLARWRAGLPLRNSSAGKSPVRAMARKAECTSRTRRSAICGGKARRCCASRKAASPTAPTATATGSSSPRCPTSIRRPGSATWLGRRLRSHEWATAPKRAPRFSLISTPSRPAKCEAKSTAPTTRSRSCAISATARKSLSSPRKAAPTSNMTIGARRCGCSANICATTTTRRCSRQPPTAGRYTRARAISS